MSISFYLSTLACEVYIEEHDTSGLRFLTHQVSHFVMKRINLNHINDHVIKRTDVREMQVEFRIAV